MNAIEQVLVVRRSLLDRLGSFQGLKAAVNDYLPVFLDPSNHFFIPRPEAEEDPSLKQLIPYIVVTCGGRILHYRRGGTSGEKRLARKGSVGIGGHINDGDGLGNAFDHAAYNRALIRELQEEISFDGPFVERPLALLNDDSNPVGEVHLGIVHQCEIALPEVKANEDAIAEIGFRSFAELVGMSEDLETWSQLVIGGWEGLRRIGS
jgi:predicted NUDIX family phosphoesterase